MKYLSLILLLITAVLTANTPQSVQPKSSHKSTVPDDVDNEEEDEETDDDVIIMEEDVNREEG